MGRFTQIDPIGFGGGLNLYGYANGDPVNFRDPSGLMGTSTQEAPDDDSGDEGLCEDGESLWGCYYRLEPGSPEWYAMREVLGLGSPTLNLWGGVLSSCAESIGCLTSMIPAGGVGNMVSKAFRPIAQRAPVWVTNLPKWGNDLYHTIPVQLIPDLLQGSVTKINGAYTQLGSEGFVNGVRGVFEIGYETRGSLRVITHLFFNPIR